MKPCALLRLHKSNHPIPVIFSVLVPYQIELQSIASNRTHDTYAQLTQGNTGTLML